MQAAATNAGKRKEGEITVDYKSRPKIKKRKDRGEYIEYEEIKD